MKNDNRLILSIKISKYKDYEISNREAVRILVRN